MSIDIKAVAAEHKGKLLEICSKLSTLKGWNMKSAQGALSLIPEIVKFVEGVGKVRDLSGEEKNELAVEFILLLLPLPWWMPLSFAKPLLGSVVSAVVDALKSKFD